MYLSPLSHLSVSLPFCPCPTVRSITSTTDLNSGTLVTTCILSLPLGNRTIPYLLYTTYKYCKPRGPSP